MEDDEEEEEAGEESGVDDTGDCGTCIPFSGKVIVVDTQPAHKLIMPPTIRNHQGNFQR